MSSSEVVFACANRAVSDICICECHRQEQAPRMTAEEVRAQQAALYGEPLNVRFGRVLEAFGIPQSRLAAVIGLSAPMLSQLASAQRVKISNPAVYARLLRLEELAGTAAVRTGDPTVRA